MIAALSRLRRRSIRSGYAFAHQEGFGRLITSGTIMRPPSDRGGVSSFATAFHVSRALLFRLVLGAERCHSCLVKLILGLLFTSY